MQNRRLPNWIAPFLALLLSWTSLSDTVWAVALGSTISVHHELSHELGIVCTHDCHQATRNTSLADPCSCERGTHECCRHALAQLRGSQTPDLVALGATGATTPDVVVAVCDPFERFALSAWRTTANRPEPARGPPMNLL